MENLISLVNKLQRACTALGDHGEESALPTLWDSLPAIAVVGGQVIRRFLIFLLLHVNTPVYVDLICFFEETRPFCCHLISCGPDRPFCFFMEFSFTVSFCFILSLFIIIISLNARVYSVFLSFQDLLFYSLNSCSLSPGLMFCCFFLSLFFYYSNNSSELLKLDSLMPHENFTTPLFYSFSFLLLTNHRDMVNFQYVNISDKFGCTFDLMRNS